jgi:hypothetical protein
MDRVKSSVRKQIEGFLSVVLGVLVCSLSSCGPEKPAGFDEYEPHLDILLGIAVPDGRLAAWFGFGEPIRWSCQPLGEAALCGTTDPGFGLVELVGGPLRPLPDGVPIIFELVEATQGARVQKDGLVAANPGDRLFLGTSPNLHTHVEWHFLGSLVPTLTRVSFRLLDGRDPRGYGTSDVYTLTFLSEAP